LSGFALLISAGTFRRRYGVRVPGAIGFQRTMHHYDDHEDEKPHHKAEQQVPNHGVNLLLLEKMINLTELCTKLPFFDTL
jgi:hypothetical protein